LARNIPDALIAFGALAVVAGVALMHVPAAVILAGLVAIAVGVLLSLRPKDARKS
jgi:hypothetical protein